MNDYLIKRPVSKVFFHYLIPAICATMVTSIYVLADTIIIGKFLGSTAMAALNIVLPVFNVFFGMGLLFGVGGSVLMSVFRGGGDFVMDFLSPVPVTVQVFSTYTSAGPSKGTTV